jgi:hypothetical protein
VDTQFRTYSENFTDDSGSEVLDGSGFSETLKGSNLSYVTVKNKTFLGTPSEDDIDFVRGGPYFVGPNDHSQSKAGKQNVTVKGGAQVSFAGAFGCCVAGQYSIYDRWCRGPKTKVHLCTGSVGVLDLWWAEWEGDASYVEVIKRSMVKVYGYFIWRSLVQTIWGNQAT